MVSATKYFSYLNTFMMNTKLSRFNDKVLQDHLGIMQFLSNMRFTKVKNHSSVPSATDYSGAIRICNSCVNSKALFIYKWKFWLFLVDEFLVGLGCLFFKGEI